MKPPLHSATAMRSESGPSPRLLLTSIVVLGASLVGPALRADDRAVGSTPAPVPAATPVAAPADASRVLDRVVAIGASATAGFGVVASDRTRPELGSFPVPLAAAIGGVFEPSAATVDFGSGFFFLDPSIVGQKAVEKAVEAKPTCIVAIDFLFWFVYGVDDGKGGPLASDEARLEKLELGLALLERIPTEIPLLVGDLPDMRDAVGRILSPSQVPTPVTLARANERVLAWIAGRPNSFRFRLADTTSRLARGEPVIVAGVKVEPRPNAPLLQPDRLHPTFRGTVTLGLQVADTLTEAFGAPVATRVVRDETVAAARTRTIAGEREAERRSERQAGRKSRPAPSGELPREPARGVSGSGAPAGAR